jgi:hypothetical protein
LSKAEHEAAEWQAAAEALILVATSGGRTMFFARRPLSVSSRRRKTIGMFNSCTDGIPNLAVDKPRG